MMRFWRDFGATRTATVIIGAFFIIAITFSLAWFFPVGQITYSNIGTNISLATTSVMMINQATSTDLIGASSTPIFVVTHLPTPNPLKGVYMTSWASGSKKSRDHLFDLVDNTEINAVVIDVKDYTGRISFSVSSPELIATGAAESRIPDVRQFIGALHKKGVYVIARISAFQDSYLINIHPEWAVKTKTGEIWKDYKGVRWLDPGAKPVWDYLAAIGNESYAIGFDELNFDYVRFPSDGNLDNISYSWSDGKSRSEIMKEFFVYIHDQFASTSIPISADLFGLTTSAEGDLGIGQILEYALKYFDYVSPMVYPSHFGYGFNGHAKPAQYPYEVVKYSMDKAISKAEATTTRLLYFALDPIASTTSQSYTREIYDKNKLRPWLQAFDLGAIYTPEMIRSQIQATYDSGLTSWMLWNAGSVYDKAALEVEN
ncbi:MAG: putative glycoside hydrolase [Patescibacteria group bacterium]